MTIYRFSIEVDGLDPEDGKREDRFYGNGVDDALIFITNGQLYLAFDCKAQDQGSAINSAINDIVQRGGSVRRVTWDQPRSLG